MLEKLDKYPAVDISPDRWCDVGHRILSDGDKAIHNKSLGGNSYFAPANGRLPIF